MARNFAKGLEYEILNIFKHRFKFWNGALNVANAICCKK